MNEDLALSRKPNSQRPFFSAEYSFRNPLSIAFGAIFGLLGCFFVFFVVYVVLLRSGVPPEWLDGKPVNLLGRLLFTILGLPAGVLMIHFATRMFRAAKHSVRAILKIDQRGITFGKEEYGWESISWIGGRRSMLQPNRFFLVARVHHLGMIALPTEPLLERNKLNEILDGIRNGVLADHPELHVGGRSGWFGRLRMPGPLQYIG